MKPWPSAPPRRFSAGTRSSSKNSSAVSVLCWPTFFRTRPRAKPGVVVVDFGDQQGDAVRALGGVGLGDDDDQAGVVAVGDEGLGAADDVLVAVADRFGGDVLQVRPGPGLGHGDRADQVAGGHARQPAELLLLGGVGVDVVRDDAGVHDDRHRAGAGAHLRLGDGDLVGEGAAPAAVLLRDGGAQQPDLPGRLPDVPAREALRGELVLARQRLVGEEGRRELAQRLHIVGRPGRSAHLHSISARGLPPNGD